MARRRRAKKANAKASQKKVIIAKEMMCPWHCPSWMLWLFGLLGLWFTLNAFGIPTWGGFWSWVVFLSGLCAWMCSASAEHKRSVCPFAGLPIWWGVLTTLIGAWFILGDVGTLPTYGINLLYLATLLAALGLGSCGSK